MKFSGKVGGMTRMTPIENGLCDFQYGHYGSHLEKPVSAITLEGMLDIHEIFRKGRGHDKDDPY